MADDGFRIEVSETLGRRLVAAAEAAGQPVGDFAETLITQGLEDDWAEDIARFEDYDRTGEYIDAETAMREFREELARRLREKRK